MTDLHCHVLPRIDDGSSSVQESLEMLRALYAQGVRTVVATPHFYADSDTPARFLARRQKALRSLLPSLEEEDELPQLKMGAEVHYFSGMSESDSLMELTLSGGRAMLVEMPFGPWTDGMYRELEDIYTRRGIIPVIAHVERYLRPLQSAKLLDRLGQTPALLQVNASFITAGRVGMRYLKQGKIHLLGSDSHNMTDRAPNMGPALERIRQKLGSETLEEMNRRAKCLLE